MKTNKEKGIIQIDQNKYKLTNKAHMKNNTPMYTVMIAGALIISTLTFNVFEKDVVEAKQTENVVQESINRDNARLARLKLCNENVTLVKEYHLPKQDLGTRCATILTLSKDYSPVENVLENINAPSEVPEFWNIYYDIKSIRIKNNIPVITSIEKQGSVDLDKQAMFDFVREWEGAFQSEAFCDSYYKTNKKLIRHPAHLCKKWTIWFGTNSYSWEIITYNEAIKRKQDAILSRNAKITSTCLTQNQRIAIVDFTYQYSSHYVNQMRKYANNCQIDKAYQYIVSHRDFYKWKDQWGLVKREQKRIEIFYNK